MKVKQLAGIGLFIFAMIVIYESLKLSLWKHGFPMSGLFPFLLSLLLAILSVQYFLSFRLKERGKKLINHFKSQWAEGPETVLEESKVNLKKVLLSIGAVVAYPFLFINMGYIIGTMIFLVFMCKFVEKFKILATLIVSLVTIIVSYAIFVLLLKVPLH